MIANRHCIAIKQIKCRDHRVRFVLRQRFCNDIGERIALEQVAGVAKKGCDVSCILERPNLIGEMDQPDAFINAVAEVIKAQKMHMQIGRLQHTQFASDRRVWVNRGGAAHVATIARSGEAAIGIARNGLIFTMHRGIPA